MDDVEKYAISKHPRKGNTTKTSKSATTPTSCPYKVHWNKGLYGERK
jgi:hypothetical protein